MAKTPSKTRQLTATLWSLVFAVCLGLAVAHLVQAIQGQRSQETNLIEATFTQAPKAPSGGADAKQSTSVKSAQIHVITGICGLLRPRLASASRKMMVGFASLSRHPTRLWKQCKSRQLHGSRVGGTRTDTRRLRAR
jgi:hypothetical protein